MKFYLFLLVLPFYALAMQDSTKTKESDKYKILTLSVNVWRNEQYDPELWKKIYDRIEQLKSSPFSVSRLDKTIDDLVALTEEKKGNGIWGGLTYAYQEDSEKTDKPTREPLTK